MKAIFTISTMTAFLVFVSPCFALWMIAPVTEESAKKMGMDVRSERAGPNNVRIELEFMTKGRFEEFSPEGKFNDRSRVELRFGEGNNPLVIAPLREDRSKQGRVVVSFTADRTELDKLSLWLMAPESDGGTVYQLRIKDFVQQAPAPARIPGKVLEQRLEAAIGVYEQNLARAKAGQAHAMELFGWSEHWRDAELALATREVDRVQALRDHLDRTRDVERMMDLYASKGQGRQADFSAATYYRLQAEVGLYEAGVEPQPASDVREKAATE